MKASVLIPSYRRAARLASCLRALAAQTTPPAEVLVVWQGDDAATRDAAEALRGDLPYPLRLLHSAEPGVVAAENTALRAATSDVVLLIDDDAIPPRDWIARHLAHYADPRVGAVGGPADNFRPDGEPFPRRAVEPVGRLAWYGKPHGNMYDQPEAWRSRPPAAADHLVGYNLSFRRAALAGFEDGLKPYWQMFEMDACLQARAAGFRVVFDFANVVEHHPTNQAYTGGRDGDLRVKVFHAAFNHAFILAKHSAPALRPWRLLFLLAVGSVATPGVVGSIVAARRFGNPLREMRVLAGSWRHTLAGWRAGSMARRGSRVPVTERKQ